MHVISFYEDGRMTVDRLDPCDCDKDVNSVTVCINIRLLKLLYVCIAV